MNACPVAGTGLFHIKTPTDAVGEYITTTSTGILQNSWVTQ
jgi:hypothetical protein